jgi:hypothetical protein
VRRLSSRLLPSTVMLPLPTCCGIDSSKGFLSYPPMTRLTLLAHRREVASDLPFIFAWQCSVPPPNDQGGGNMLNAGPGTRWLM